MVKSFDSNQSAGIEHAGMRRYNLQMHQIRFFTEHVSYVSKNIYVSIHGPAVAFLITTRIHGRIHSLGVLLLKIMRNDYFGDTFYCQRLVFRRYIRKRSENLFHCFIFYSFSYFSRLYEFVVLEKKTS